MKHPNFDQHDEEDKRKSAAKRRSRHAAQDRARGRSRVLYILGVVMVVVAVMFTGTACVGSSADHTEPARESTGPQRALDDALERATASVPEQGIQAVLLQDGKLLWSAERGMAIMNLHPPKPVDDKTMFNYGSFGKLVLGAFTLRQIESGVLSLDAPISEYVGDEIAGSNVVTIRMLLSHTAGYNSVYAAPETISLFAPGTEDAPVGVAPMQYDPNTPFTFDRLNAGIHQPENPGAKFHYENTNFIVLYQVLVKRLGSVAAVQDGIANFLEGAGSVAPEDGTQISQDRYAQHTLENVAHGYQPLSDDRGLHDYNTAYGAVGVPVDSMGFPFGDGAFGGTALGAAQVLDALFARGVLLDDDTVREMTTPTRQSLGTDLHYGLATLINDFAGRTWKGHPGGFTGFTSTVYTDIGNRATLAVVTNRSGTDTDSDAIWEALATAYATAFP